MLQFDLNAQVRNNFGKCGSRRLRVDGLTPAILYGYNTEPVALQMNTKELTQTLLKVQRRNAVYTLTVKNDQSDVSCHVMVKELQTDPISDGLLHADFCAISLDAPLVFTVPVTFVGKAKGVELGGDMTIFIKNVTLKGRPLDIPESVEKDISDLGVDAKITCADLNIPAGVELITDKNTVCVSVVMPVKVQVEETAAPAKKGKKK